MMRKVFYVNDELGGLFEEKVKEDKLNMSNLIQGWIKDFLGLEEAPKYRKKEPVES